MNTALLPAPLRTSPLVSFVDRNWHQFDQRLVSARVTADNMLLFLVWSLEFLREDDPAFLSDPWGRTYSALREYNIYNSTAADQAELEYLTHVVYAMTLSCVGSMIDSLDPRRQLYGTLVQAAKERMGDIRRLKLRISYGSLYPDLRQWMLQYWESDIWYTCPEMIKWDEAYPQPNQHRKNMEVNNPTNCTFIEKQIVENQIVQQQTVQQQVVSTAATPEGIAPAASMEELPASAFSWMHASWDMKKKQDYVLQLRNELQEASREMGSVQRKKQEVLYSVFWEKLKTGKIQRMPSYEVARQLFGELECFPSKNNYYQAVKYIKTSEKESRY